MAPSHQTVREPIAVIGIGCRLPGDLESKDALWRALCEGANLVTEVPADRFDVDQLHDDGKRKNGYVNNRKGGFLTDPYSFDAEFFGIHPAEASRLDPQQRIALETAVHAIEDSGTPLEVAAGSRTSVFFGSFTSDHLTMTASSQQRDNISPHAAMGAAATSIPNRISHRLNLQGPSVFVDTACSSGLVAVHYACQSLWTNEADYALAGGINAILRPEFSIIMSRAGFLSSDGSCKSFDADADGYVRSEGCGAVYLKRLSTALEDNDRIYGLVRGSLVNSDGFTPEGLTVPSMMAQTNLIRSVYSQAGVDPSTVRYIEAHGPGTQVGDPLEAGAVGAFFGPLRDKSEGPLLISSIKGNLGHLEGAAGIAGFIKAALVTYHGTIPPQINFKTPNPKIDFTSLRLAIPMKSHDLRRNEHDVVHVGVNSFGAGGTNAHVVLETPTPQVAAAVNGMNGTSHHRLPRVFILSARTTPALENVAQNLRVHLQQLRPTTKDVAYTLTKRRSRHRHIAIIPAQNLDRLCTQLLALGAGKPPKEVSILQKGSTTPKVAFAFSGQGGQWLDMGKQLADQEPLFHQSLIAFDAIFKSLSKRSILDEIFTSTGGSSRFESTVVVQPAIAAIQIALANTLMAYGLLPSAVVGHSIGEVAAAHIAGALTLEQAVLTIHLRSSIQAQAAGKGTMLAVGLSQSEAQKLLQRIGLVGKVELAAMNGPKFTTLAGDTKSLELVLESLNRQGTFARAVNVDVPYHSQYMDPLKSDLVNGLDAVKGTSARIDLYSTVTTNIEPGTHLTGKYWFENVREPVRYVETIQKMMDDGFDTFFEIGPHPVLVSGTRGVAEAAKRKIHAIPAMVRGDDVTTFSKALATAFALGIDVQLHSFNGGGGNFIDLPLYPFDRQHYSFEHPTPKQMRLGRSKHPFYEDSSIRVDDNRGTLQLRLDTGVSPFLLDHVIDGTAILPATAHIEAAFLAAQVLMPGIGSNAWLQDLQFQHPIVLASPEDFSPQAVLEITSAKNDYVFSSRPADAKPHDSWQSCSKGRINIFDRFPEPDRTASLHDIRSQLHSWRSYDVEKFYSNLESSNLRYGEAFRGVRQLWQLGTQVFASIKVPDNLKRESAHFRLHPALFDACLHAAFVDVFYRGNFRYAYLPSHIEAIRVGDGAGITEAYVHVQVMQHDNVSLRCNFTIYNEDGNVLAVGVGLTAKRLPSGNDAPPPHYGISFVKDPLAESVRVENEIRNAFIIQDQEDLFQLSDVVRAGIPEAEVVQLPLSSAKELDTSTKTMLDRRSVIMLAALEKPDLTIMEQIGPVMSSLLSISHWIRKDHSTPTVIVVTGGIATRINASPVSAAIDSAVRVLVNELPYARFRVIDINLTPQANDWAYEQLKDEISFSHIDRYETFVALRSEGRFVRRITHEDKTSYQRALPARGGMYYCETKQPGLLDSIVFRQRISQGLEPDEVGVEIHASGLNFKDIMNAMGLLDPRAVEGGLCSNELGLEIAGTVISVGEQVQGFKTGDRVMGMARNGLAGFAVAKSDLISHVPTHMSMSEAACSVLAYMTAYYGLLYLGRLEADDTVLIHSGAGGVGAAAIQVAKHVGARVFATAGSASRRDWLSRQRVDLVLDSRSPSFHDEIKVATHGRGVDVVLNSLTGDLFSQSVACLAPFGRFIEIGKTDVYRNMRLGLEQFGDNKSFSVVDIDRLAAQKPRLYHRMQNGISKLLQDGRLMPLPTIEYPIHQLSKALGELSRSNVIGKVAITMPEDVLVDVETPNTLSLHPDRTYLITGGASGLGPQFARFLVEKGARHLLLASRSGPKTAEDEAIIHEMHASGVKVWMESLDVTDSSQVKALFSDQRDWPQIAGVIHAAAVLHDVFSYNMEISDFWTVFKPKAMGAWYLHEATAHLDLDFFVMTSSFATVVAFPGGISYSASNQFLDALAHRRHGLGLPATSLNIGLLGEYAGITRTSNKTSALTAEEALRPQGVIEIPLPEVFDAFEKAVLAGVPQRIVADVDFTMYKQSHPHLHREGAFMNVGANEGRSQKSANNSDSWASLPHAQVVDAVGEKLRFGIAKMTGFKAERVAMGDKIDYYASDSLTITQLRGFILREFKFNFPFMRLMQAPTIREIASQIAESFNRDSTDDAGASSSTAHGADAFSDDLTIISKWFVRGKPTPSAKARLVCFHPAGIGASFFTSFLLNPPPNLDVTAIQLPARESRIHEPAATDLDTVVNGILAELPHSLGAGDIFWGASLGGILAFEVLRALQRQGRQLPQLLITGSIPPHLSKSWEKRELARMMLSRDTNPDTFLAMMGYVDNAEFIRPIIEATRTDADMIRNYRYTGEEVLETRITAFAGRRDDLVYPDDVAAWGRFAREFEFVEVEGSHFFVHANEGVIRRTLEGMAGGKADGAV